MLQIKFDYIKVKLINNYQYESENEEEQRASKKLIKEDPLKSQQKLMRIN